MVAAVALDYLDRADTIVHCRTQPHCSHRSMLVQTSAPCTGSRHQRRYPKIDHSDVVGGFEWLANRGCLVYELVSVGDSYTNKPTVTYNVAVCSKSAKRKADPAGSSSSAALLA